MTEIKVNSSWRHHKGKFIIVVGITNDGDSDEQRVLYRHMNEAKIWDHKVSDFLTSHGEYQRFQYIGDFCLKCEAIEMNGDPSKYEHTCFKDDQNQGYLTHKERLLLCSKKLDAYAKAIEPLFKAGSNSFAPGTDWWCVIAGWRHCAQADVRMLTMMAESIDKPRQFSECPRELSTRKRHISESEVESPCGEGCMLTWKRQYGNAEDTK